MTFRIIAINPVGLVVPSAWEADVEGHNLRPAQATDKHFSCLFGSRTIHFPSTIYIYHYAAYAKHYFFSCSTV